MPRFLFALAAASMLSAAALAQLSAGHLLIGHPWSRPTLEGVPGVAYFTITNTGTRADTLIAARSPAAARVEFHRTIIEGGMAKMRPAGAIEIAPGSTVNVEPRGLHLMLFDLRSRLVEGTTVPLILTFKVAGDVTVQLKVERPENSAAAPHH